MFQTRKLWTLLLIPFVLSTLAACSHMTEPVEEDELALQTVIPTGGDTNVDPNEPVVLQFNHPIHAGMEAYAALHLGDVTGPEVDGVWTVSEDGTKLTFTPSQPLLRATTYTIHVGGGMTDDHGSHVNLGTHGLGMGGSWATGTMMNGGAMGGGMGGSNHMGEGWQHPDNGTYGMVFTFTTAA